MKSSMLCQRLFACFFVMVLCVATTLAVPASFLTLSDLKPNNYKRQILFGDCTTDVGLAQVCYQCGELHEQDLDLVYRECCYGAELERGKLTREYCLKTFSEPPKRGGLWA